MDKRQLKAYRKNKSRLERIDRRIDYLCGKDVPVVSGKVVGSSEDFPYTEIRTSVKMYEPVENDAVNGEIRKLTAERIVLQELVDAVDEYIASISDGEYREIHERIYLNGESQTAVGVSIGYSQGRISQIIEECLKINNINNLDML